MLFNPNPLQLQHLIDRGDHRYNLILKFRQGGVTTLYIIDELDDAIWIPGMSCGIVADQAKRLPSYFGIAKLAFDYFPDKLRPKTKTDTKYMYEFTHRFDGDPLDSSIYVAMDVRGGTVQRLHITESAWIADRQKLKASSKQAVPLTGWISEETTGNGYNEFFDDYEGARAVANPAELDYKTYFYAWVQNPEYSLPGQLSEKTKRELEIMQIAKDRYGIDITDGQLIWRQWKMRDLATKREAEGMGLTGEQLFKQEYPLTIQEAFQAGAGNVFDGEKVDAIFPLPAFTQQSIEVKYRVNWQERSPQEKEIIEVLLTGANELLKLNVTLWSLPDPRKQYVVGIDPSDGEGADSSAIDVWEFDQTQAGKRRQVAQFYGKVRPDELAEIGVAMAKYYNKAFMGVENNMLTTILYVSKVYDNYYFELKVDERSAKRTKKIGFNTNSMTRDLIIDNFLIAFDEDALEINSTVTIREMKTFIKNRDSKRREHANGKHDDALFAGFIAGHMIQFYPHKARVFQQKPF